MVAKGKVDDEKKGRPPEVEASCPVMTGQKSKSQRRTENGHDDALGDLNARFRTIRNYGADTNNCPQRRKERTDQCQPPKKRHAHGAIAPRQKRDAGPGMNLIDRQEELAAQRALTARNARLMHDDLAFFAP